MEFKIYPDILPLPQTSFGGKYATPTVVTQFTSGKVRRRRVGRTAVKQVTMEWLFTPDEYDLWEMFYRMEVDDGCSPFEIDMVSGGALQTGKHVVQFVGDYSYSHEECNWRVSIECVILAYPKGSEDLLLEGYLGMTIEQMNEIILKYYDRRHML